MRPRNLVIITLFALCHLQLSGQALTNALPAAYRRSGTGRRSSTLQPTMPPLNFPTIPARSCSPSPSLSPSPPAECPSSSMPTARRALATCVTLDGHVVVHYRDYILRADKVVYHQSTSELEADGHLQVTGGPNGVLINASHGDMRLEHAHRALLQRQRFAGNPLRRPHQRLLHFHSLSVYRQGPAPDRRRQLPPHRRHHDQLPASPGPTGRSSPAPSIWTTARPPPPTPSSSFSACPSFICPTCAIRWTRPAAKADS